MSGWGNGDNWHGSLEWTGDEPVMPDESTPVEARRQYTRWPWDAWSSGVEHKFVGEVMGKTPKAMSTLWRTWASRPQHKRTVHSYFGSEDGVLYVLLSMARYDETHVPAECDLCGRDEEE